MAMFAISIKNSSNVMSVRCWALRLPCVDGLLTCALLTLLPSVLVGRLVPGRSVCGSGAGGRPLTPVVTAAGPSGTMSASTMTSPASAPAGRGGRLG